MSVFDFLVFIILVFRLKPNKQFDNSTDAHNSDKQIKAWQSAITVPGRRAHFVDLGKTAILTIVGNRVPDKNTEK